MKKKLVILLVVGMVMITGCGGINTQPDKEVQGDNTKLETTDTGNTEAEEQTEATEQVEVTEQVENTKSMEEEMAEIEKASLEYENMDWDIPQQEMNMKACEWYELWDAELNSLWGRLMENVPEDKKEQLRLNQREWVDRKEKNVIASGIEAYGGSLQPLLEYSMAKDMTRKQAYYLASCLAEVTGEGYSVPEAVEQSYRDVDMNLSDVFTEFAGKHRLSEDVELCVTRLEDSEYNPEDFPEGTSWLTWCSHGDILTDQNIYAYTKDVLVFLKNGTYYVVEKGYVGNEIIMTSGTELEYMDRVQ